MKEGEAKAKSEHPIFKVTDGVYNTVKNYLDPRKQDIQITE
jgi:hypothetical protein